MLFFFSFQTAGQLDAILHDIQGLSKGIESMKMHKNQIYENVKRAENTNSDQSHPYRTEMSLTLSYNGNKSKYSTNQNADRVQESEIDTPPANVPQAMKLLPNKLPYASKSEIFKQSFINAQHSEQGHVNIENAGNEIGSSKSQFTQSDTSNTAQNTHKSENSVEQNHVKDTENRKSTANGEAHESTSEKQSIMNPKANDQQILVSCLNNQI